MRFSGTMLFFPAILAMYGVAPAAVSYAQTQVGIFDNQGDIGTLLHPGGARYDPEKRSYTVSGSGDNMWFGSDDFHYVWKKMSGDVALSADISFVGAKGNNHRKAALVIRQSLEPNSVYADVALHGDGLTSLQYRDAAGADTHEVESNVSAPRRVRIEKRGQEVYVYVGDQSNRLTYSGAALRSTIKGDFYVGLGVCSHDKDVTEEAVFSNVSIEPLSALPGREVLWSTLETVKIASTDRLVAYTVPGKIDAVTWSKDVGSLSFSQTGKIYKKTLGDETPPQPADPSMQSLVGISESVSPDGKWRAFFVPGSTSDGSDTELKLVSLKDHTTKVLAKLNRVPGTSNTLSWSADNSRIAFINYAQVSQ